MLLFVVIAAVLVRRGNNKSSPYFNLAALATLAALACGTSLTLYINSLVGCVHVVRMFAECSFISLRRLLKLDPDMYDAMMNFLDAKA